ncbi:hypothetical protein [Obesumbacterium proteus]|uniref:hypothetical protein n=1 Tax=Obesumbacterium proteus TaxID=82983 RepID=UPI001F3C1F8F|nr:hypothetical protein [Obesumbacterium proteus]MCE9886360.1 hypothetical protein [Obesumbacterium proteus]MCE9916257.1 hypothetical protein [Obesumbacterium proteus]MCE9931870.1 hypothetical protein [Obesumbacterium proteus]MCG2878243.1 hypothetical protein [Obesumbacterium proteus]
MQSNTDFRRLHYALTVVLLVIVIIGAWLWMRNPATNAELYRIQDLGDGLYLYVTLDDKGGATVANIYRYYLRDKGSLQQIVSGQSFLTTNQPDVTVKREDNSPVVNIYTSGTVYQFTNSIGYYPKPDDIRLVSVKLIAYPFH